MILRDLVNDETGASAIEYAVLIALVAVGLVTALSSLGTQSANTYSSANRSLEGMPESTAEPPAPAPEPMVPTRPGGGNRVPM